MGRQKMTLIKYELKKLRGARRTFLVTALLIAAGLLFIYWRLTVRTDGCSLVQQAQLFHSVETDTPDEMARLIKHLWKEQVEALTLAVGADEDTLKEERARYSEQLILCGSLLPDLEAVSDYDRTLEELIEGEGNISVLMTGSEYRRRDLEAARLAYGRLSGLELSPVFSGGIELLLDQPVLDLILVLIAGSLVLFLFQSEYDGGALAYIRMTRNGVLPTLTAKLTVLVGLLIPCSLLLYGGGLAIVCGTTGSLPWEAPVQGVAAMVQCPFRICIGEFIFLFFSLKIFSILALALFFSMLCVIWRGAVLASAGFGVIFGLEWLLYRYISPFSTAGVLSQINLLRIWNSLSLFSKWGTVDFLDHPVPGWALRVFLLTALAAVSVIGLVLFFSPPQGCEPRDICFKGGRMMRRLFARQKVRPLFHYEAKKLWRIEHCVLLLTILLVVGLFVCARTHKWMSVADFYYERYIDLLAGEPSTEKDEAVGKIEADFAEKERLLNLAAERLSAGEITEDEYRALRDFYSVSNDQQEGWERALADYKRTVELRRRGVNAACISQDGWELLFGTEGRLNDLRLFLCLAVFLILGLSGYGAMEQTSGMTPLLRLYPNRMRIVSAKYVNAAGYAAVMSLAAFVPRRLAVMDRYGLSLGAWSIQSLRFLESAPPEMPVWFLFALQTAMGITVAVLCAELLLALSWKLKSRITTIFVGVGILIVPAWILLVVYTLQ